MTEEGWELVDYDKIPEPLRSKVKAQIGRLWAKLREQQKQYRRALASHGILISAVRAMEATHTNVTCSLCGEPVQLRPSREPRVEAPVCEECAATLPSDDDMRAAANDDDC